MIEFKFKWDEKDLAIFKKNTDQFAENMDVAIKKAAYLVRNTAVAKISRGSRSGRLYKRGAIVHRASAKGEFPKTDTGRLVTSIRVDHDYLTARVGSDLDYAGFLETKNPENGGRPWLMPSYDLVHDQITNLFTDVLKRTFNL